MGRDRQGPSGHHPRVRLHEQGEPGPHRALEALGAYVDIELLVVGLPQVVAGFGLPTQIGVVLAPGQLPCPQPGSLAGSERGGDAFLEGSQSRELGAGLSPLPPGGGGVGAPAGVGDQVLGRRLPSGLRWLRLRSGQPPPQGPLRDTALGGDCDHRSPKRQPPGDGMAHAGHGEIPIGWRLPSHVDRYAQPTPDRNGTPIGYFSYHLGR